MPLETSSWKSTSFPAHQVNVTSEMIDSFCDAIGESRRDQAPPTFPIRLDMEGDHAKARLDSLGIPMESVLHAEQSFTQERPIRAGHLVTCKAHLTDVLEKKGGALLIVTFVTEFTDDQGVLGDMTFTVAVRNTP